MVEFRTGTFYLGGSKPPGEDPAAELLEYDARDLVTHGVIVGMTGSGKTGLAIGMLEEALLSGIPVLAIDPKGDLGNLLLTFPDLRPEDFRPWINEGDAERKGLSPDGFAAAVAEQWKTGLASWGIGPERIRQLRDGADFSIVTPGSSAGLPMNVLGSLAAPALSWDTDAETLRDEIEGFVTSLLGMAGIAADPIASREHVLLSNVIEASWRQGLSLDLATLIQQVQQPPIRKLGVFEVDAFFPPKDRTELAMRLNGLAASPSFAAWLEGAPLDIGAMLGDGGSGRPRATIVSLSHLSDGERQFVVTLLLSKVVTWMRGLSGTTDLRALVYFDEVFGFVPPTESPPAKKPILTLLKTARAFGVGLVLATQNPVDLDYKAMSNAGTWFVGRLQTERDKARIVEALSSAGGNVDVASLDQAISGLEQRRFLMHDTHEPPPRVFQTRWVMSYLRGPLTREQIAALMHDRPVEAAPPPPPPPAPGAAPAAPAPAVTVYGDDVSPVAPEVATGVAVYHLDPAAPWAPQVGAVAGSTKLRAALVARVHLRFDDTRAAVDHTEEWEAVFVPAPEHLDPAAAAVVDVDTRDLRPGAPAGAAYELPAAPLGQARYFKEAAGALKAHLVRERSVVVLRNAPLKLYSRVGETAEQFAARCDAAAQEGADAEAAKIRDRLESKRDRLEAALATARRQAEEAETNVKARTQQETISGAGSVIGILLGGRGSARDIARRAGGAIGSASSRRGMTARAKERMETAREKVADRTEDLQQLEAEVVEEVTSIDAKWREKAAAVEQMEIGLEATDVDVDEVAVLWIPVA